MALTNYERVSKAIKLLAEGLAPFVDRVCRALYGDNWPVAVQPTDRGGPSRKVNPEDLHFLLNVMWDKWQPTFRKKLQPGDRNYISELRYVRNSWAHNYRFSTDDTLRALDTAKRLLKSAAAADQATQVDELYQDLLRQDFDQEAQDTRHQAAAAPSQPTYSSKPTEPVSREIYRRPTGYTLFGVHKPWRSGIGMWVDVVEQVYYRHKSDFLQKAKKRLRLTPSSNLILIFEQPLNEDRDWKETGVPGIFVYSNLKVIRFIELAYKLLELFEHSPSDLHFHFNGEGAKPIDYSSKPANTGFSREVDERPIGYSLFGDYRPWRSGIGMWADVVEQVYSCYENDFLEKAQKLRLARSNYFLRDGVLISDDPEKINRPRGPIKPRETSVPLYIERSLKVDVLIELAYELLKLFGHPPSDLQIHE